MFNKFNFYELNEPCSILFEKEASTDLGKNKNNLWS